MSVARTTVAGLLSPQIFGASGVQHVSGDVLDLRSYGCGKMWDFHNAAERVKVRKKVVSEKAVHRHRFVLRSLADWPTAGYAICHRGQGSGELRYGGVQSPVGPNASLSA